MKPALAVFGGSFDPPHIGHVFLATYALSVGAVARVAIAPAFQHAFAKSLCDFDHRLRMCELAFAPLARTEVSPIERELGGTSRTLRLVQALAARHPDHQLRLLIGADILLEAQRWRGFDEICRLAPPLVAWRAGFAPPDAPAKQALTAPSAPPPNAAPRARASQSAGQEPDLHPPLLPEVSSTRIREALTRGLDVAHSVPASVCAYIDAHGLYRASAP